jgi:hypothetical protein
MHPLRNAAAAVLALACLFAGGPGLADNYVVKDGNGASKTMCSKTQTGVEHSCHVLEGKKPDGTFGPVNIDPAGNVIIAPAATEAAAGSNAAKATSVQALDGGKPFPVSQTPFTPTGPADLAVSTISARQGLPTTDQTVVLINNGGSDIRYLLGNSSVVATTSSFLLPIGTSIELLAGANTHVSAITATGTSSLSITTGTGKANMQGGIGSKAGLAATVADCADVAEGCKNDNAWDLSNTSATAIAIQKAIALKTEATRAAVATMDGHLVGLQSQFGEVQASPTANTLLDRVKTLHTDIAALQALVGEVQASPTANTLLDRLKTLQGYLDNVETLIGTTNTSLTSLITYVDQLEGYVDGIETLIGTTNTALGAPADTAWASGAGSVIALLKAIAGQAISTAPAAVKFDHTTPGDTDGAVLRAGEYHVGEVGGNQITVRVAQTVTASSAYASGNAVGGLMTLANAARVSGSAGAPGTSGLIQNVVVNSQSAQTAQVDVFFFSSNPTGTTCTDKTAFSLASTDFDKVLGVATIPATTGWYSGGTASVGQAPNLAMFYALSSSTSLYACAVVRGTPTFSATSNISIAASLARN